MEERPFKGRVRRFESDGALAPAVPRASLHACSDAPAAKRRKNAAHGASHGWKRRKSHKPRRGERNGGPNPIRRLHFRTIKLCCSVNRHYLRKMNPGARVGHPYDI